MSEPIRTGLWKKEGDRGGYYSGKIEIDGRSFYVNLYRNDRKTEEKHPDLNLQLKPKEAQAPKPAKTAPPKPDFSDDLPFN